ncbi:MAG: MATE family efflux transporter [Acidobacteriota bacterium]
MRPSSTRPDEHAFLRAPHRTLVFLSFPVLLSLIAEPLTGLADTAFVARLGSSQLAALGVGTIVLSSVFWIFNFLGIGAQTEVARAHGAGELDRAREISGLALVLGFAFGVLLILLGVPLAERMAGAMGGEGAVRTQASVYLRIRLFGGPAVVLMTAGFGALRGLQDMRTPLAIAVAVNALNVVLDALLIFGLGPIPALGIAGAAWATAVSQWIGGLWTLAAIGRRMGFPARLHLHDARLLLVVGRDLFLRTGLLTVFLLLTTRAATRMGPHAGAAHQAVRQVWVFTALVLDAFAAAAQSLIGYFRGAGLTDVMRRVAFVACAWSAGTGLVLSLAMLAAERAVAALLVPPAAAGLFAAAWRISAAAQPLNALSFATDGIHWGTGDYRFLRNVMLLASGAGALALLLPGDRGLPWIWWVTGGWIAIRALFGVARIWPGIGASPFRQEKGTRACV